MLLSNLIGRLNQQNMTIMNSIEINLLLIKLGEVAINVDEAAMIKDGVKNCLKECAIPNEILAAEMSRSL